MQKGDEDWLLVEPASPLLQHGVVPAFPAEARERLPLHLLARLEYADSHGFVNLSLLPPAFRYHELRKDLDTHYTDEQLVAYRAARKKKEPGFEVNVGECYGVYSKKLRTVNRGRVLSNRKKEVVVRMLDTGFESRVASNAIFPLPHKFITDQAALQTVGLPPPCKLPQGTVVDVLLLHVGVRCLVVVAAHQATLPAFGTLRLRHGFDKSTVQLWFRLFAKPEKRPQPLKAPLYLPNRTVLTSGMQFAMVGTVVGLDEIYIRDLASSIRIFFIQQYLNGIMKSDDAKQALQVDTDTIFAIGQPCVFREPDSEVFYRGRVRMISAGRVDVCGVDFPAKALTGVVPQDDSLIYHLPEGLELPQQAIPVKLVDNGRNLSDMRFTEILQGLLLENTPVIVKPVQSLGTVVMNLLDGHSVIQEIDYTVVSVAKSQAARFKSSLTQWSALVEVQNRSDDVVNEDGTPFKPKPRRSTADLFRASLPPQRPARTQPAHGPPAHAQPHPYCFAEEPNKVFLRNEEMEQKYTELVNKLSAIHLPKLDQPPTVNAHYLYRTMNSVVVRVKVLDFDKENDRIRYLEVDTGCIDRRNQGAFCRGARLITKQDEQTKELTPEALAPLLEGPIPMSGLSENARKTQQLKFRVALRSTVLQLRPIYVIRKEDGVVLYGEDGISVNDTYQTMVGQA